MKRSIFSISMTILINCLVVVLVCTEITIAAFTTGFENYTLSTINGQDSWTGSSGNSEAVVVSTGGPGISGKWVHLNTLSGGEFGSVSRSLAAEATDNSFRTSFFLKPDIAGDATHTYIILRSRTNNKAYVFLNFEYAYGIYVLNAAGNDWYASGINPGTNPIKLTIELDWDYSSVGRYRFYVYNLSNGTTSISSWYTMSDNYTSGPADANGTFVILSNGAVFDDVAMGVAAATNSCDTTPDFSFQEGGITSGGGNPSGDCVWYVSRDTNNHIFTWNIRYAVATAVSAGDKLYFDIKNEMVFGNATMTCYIGHDGGEQAYDAYINGLTNGHVIDSAGWKSCYVVIPAGINRIDALKFVVNENTKIVSFDNFQLTQVCPESSNISIHTLETDTLTSVEEYAARQLQAAFQAAMQVTPPINPSTPKATQIRLGLAGQFFSGVGDDSEQAYAIRKPSAGLFELVGNSEPAVLWAVNAFSEKVLNVGWTGNTNNIFDVNGSPANLSTVSLDEIGVPDFEQRGWILPQSGDGPNYDRKICNFMAYNNTNAIGEEVRYFDSSVAILGKTVYGAASARGINLDSGITHSFWWLVPDATYYATHPEYFPLVGGVRIHGSTDGSTGGQLCLSNTSVRDIIIQKAEDAFDAYPDLCVFGVVPNDDEGGWCECANCLAMDDGTDPIVNTCDTPNAFVLPTYNTGYSQEGGIIVDGNPGNAIQIISREYNNHQLRWNISPDVIQGDRLSFNVRNNMVFGNATMACWVFHDGSPTPYSPSITGLTNGSVIDSAGWKSCYFDISAGVTSIDFIVFIVEENTKIVDFDNLQLTQSDGPSSGVYSTRLIRFCNSVADALQTNYPGVKIGTLAYSEFASPPYVNVSDNVQINYCAGGQNYMKKLTDPCDATNVSLMKNINGWLSRTKDNIGLYEYYFFTCMDFCPMPYARTLCQEYPELKARGINGIIVESTTDLVADTHWSKVSPFPYVFARSTWDTSLSFQNVLADYCSKRYGPAASSMVSYHTLYETMIYNSVPVFKMFGPAAQLFPPAFTTATMNTLDGYLTSAATTVVASGTAANVAAVKGDRTMFDLFKRMKDDPASTPGIGVNVVSNPGAETDSANWGFDVQNGAGYSGTISTSNPHTGTKSFMITCTGMPNYARWYQTTSCSVTAGRKYAARFWVRATTGASGEIWCYQGAGNYGRINFQDTGSEWVQLVLPEFVADSSVVTIYVNSFGTGTVQFDDCFVAAIPLPVAASAPSPATSATGVSITQKLNWTAGSYTTSHDVYFGMNQTSVTNAGYTAGEFKGNQTGTSYNPGTLAANTTYYWRVDEIGNGGITKGTVWSFTTNDGTPVFIAAGSITSGTGTITPSLPGSITTGDILLLFIETSNQAVSISNQNGGTWTQVTNSPQYTGTAAGSTGVRLAAYWSRYNGTQGNPTVSDSGDHQMGRIIAIRGSVSSGNPWDITAGGVEAASDISGSIPGATTTATSTLVIVAIVSALPDATGTANFSSWTNANLASLTERTDNTVNAGNGGGIGIATGIKATAGAYGNTAVTLGSSAYKAMMSIAIKP